MAHDDCLTLKDLHPASLARDSAGARAEIAAVLVNPVQSFHPEFAAAERRRAPDERRAQNRELHRALCRMARRLREVCTRV